MKIRNGFVSNSSSSSFLIHGICAEDDIKKFNEIFTEKALKSIYEDHKSYLECKNYEEFCEMECDYIPEFAQNLIDVAKQPDGFNYVYLGTSWDDVKDFETGKQFKDRVEANLKEYFLPEYLGNEFGSYEEAFMC